MRFVKTAKKKREIFDKIIVPPKDLAVWLGGNALVST